MVPIESLGYQPDQDVIPIETLAPDEPAAVPSGGIEASFKTFDLLIRQSARRRLHRSTRWFE